MEKSKTIGDSVKNAAAYSSQSALLATASIILIARNKGYSEVEISALTAALAVVYNVIIVIGKKLLDKVGI